jgi:hypothetical protein
MTGDITDHYTGVLDFPLLHGKIARTPGNYIPQSMRVVSPFSMVLQHTFPIYLKITVTTYFLTLAVRYQPLEPRSANRKSAYVFASLAVCPRPYSNQVLEHMSRFRLYQTRRRPEIAHVPCLTIQKDEKKQF